MTAPPPPPPIFYSYFLSYLFSHILVTVFLACVCDCRCDSLWGLVSVERFPKVAQTRLSRVNCVRQCFLLPSADDGYCRGVTRVRWSSGWGCGRGVVMGPVSAGVEKSQYPILPPPHGQPVRSCLQAADVSPPPSELPLGSFQQLAMCEIKRLSHPVSSSDHARRDWEGEISRRPLNSGCSLIRKLPCLWPLTLRVDWKIPLTL